jgi:glyoxylase-like metal-dependent hydrolase (beta-lactamase superfamily II)
MLKGLVLVVAILVFTDSSALAAEVQSKNDLKRIADAIGAINLKSIQYSGSGFIYSVGQNPNYVAPWPRSDLKSLTRSINYGTSSMRDEVVRIQPTGEQRQVFLVSGTLACNQPGNEAQPRLWERASREHQIWISPHGVIKAAMANKAAVKTQNKEGRKITVVSFTDKGKMKVNAYVNEQDMVERVESWYGNPVTGDTMVDTHYLDYREFAGFKFPSKIIQMEGGFPALDLKVSGVKPDVPVDIQVPDNVRTDPVPVKSEKVVDGVWYITGINAYTVAIEMKDHVIAVEGPHGDQRSIPVIAEIKKLIPGKPIRYLINTHHHFDHSSGIRAYAAEGATIVTHEINRPLYEKAVVNSWNFNPDRLAKSGKKPVFQTMGDNMVLTDGNRTLELYQVVGNPHHDGIVMGYLRKEKLLIEADVYSPGPAGAEPPKVPNPQAVNLEANVRRLNLEVDRILPIHQRIVPYSELLREIRKEPGEAKPPAN